MKNFLKITLVSFSFIAFAASCSAKKQHCDAYGSISKIEKTKANTDLKTEEKSSNEVKS